MGFSRYQINIFAFAGTPTHPALPWVGGTEVVEGDKDQLESLFGSFPACVDMETIGDLEIEQVAERVNRTEAAVYRALSRVRMTLMECVPKQMAAEMA